MYVIFVVISWSLQTDVTWHKEARPLVAGSTWRSSTTDTVRASPCITMGFCAKKAWMVVCGLTCPAQGRWWSEGSITTMTRTTQVCKSMIFLSGTTKHIQKKIQKSQSRIKVHFVATFLNNFSIVFVSVLWNANCISFDNLPKKYKNSFWIKMYHLIQDVAKFRSKC